MALVKKVDDIKGFIQVMKILRSTKNIRKLKAQLCGEKLGAGTFRDTYVLAHNPKYVVKIERDMSEGYFANVTEFRNFIEYRDWTFVNKWMAPCLFISNNGQVLIQRRANWDGKKRKDYPKQVPVVFTDTKISNCGWVCDQFVFIDYSFMIVNAGRKWKTAKWFGSIKHLKQ